MSRRRTRERRVGEVVVAVDRDADGQPCGTVLQHQGRRWIIDAWPDRIAAVEPRNGALVVRLDNGSSRLLDRWDAA